MKTSVSFSHPNSIFIDDTVLQQKEITAGEPVKLEFEDGGKASAKAEPLSNFDIMDENHALFFSIPDLFGDLPPNLEFFEKSFETKGEELSPRAEIDLTEPSVFESYINMINYSAQHIIFEESEIVVGYSILAAALSREPLYQGEIISNQLVNCPKDLFIKGLEGDVPEVESISRFTGQIIELSELFFCTNKISLEGNLLEKSREKIVDVKYFMPMDFILPTEVGTPHGPISKNIDEAAERVNTSDGEGIEPHEVLLRASYDNVKMTSVSNGSIHSHDRDKKDFLEGDLTEFLSTVGQDWEEIESIDSHVEEEGKYTSVEFPSFTINIEYSNHQIPFEIVHAYGDEIETANEFIRDICIAIDDDSFHYNIRQSDPPLPARKECWTFDTNSIYRQKPGKKYNSIDEFLIHAEHIYQKKVRVPTEVLAEINRHKDEGGRKKRLASQGMDNIEVLVGAHNFGLIEIEFGELPNKFDNRYRSGAGITDFAILSDVPEDGLLISNDQNLLSFASWFQIPRVDIEDLSEISDNEYEEEVRQIIIDFVEGGPIEPEFLLDKSLEKANQLDITSEMASKVEESDIKSILRDLENEGDIIKTLIDGETNYVSSKTKEIVPTYSVLMGLANSIDSGSNIIGYETLEDFRTAIGGLSTTTLPDLILKIPEEYIYRAEEHNQIGNILQIYEAKNLSMETIDATIGETIDDSAIKCAKESDFYLICGSNDRDVQKLSMLLDVDGGQVNLS